MGATFNSLVPNHLNLPLQHQSKQIPRASSKTTTENNKIDHNNYEGLSALFDSELSTNFFELLLNEELPLPMHPFQRHPHAKSTDPTSANPRQYDCA